MWMVLYYLCVMHVISKSVKLVVGIALAIQLFSFAGFVATSTVLQKESTELVEKVRVETASKVKFNNNYSFVGLKSNVSSFLKCNPSHLLIHFNRTCYIKHKQQKFRFYNTVKNSLIAKLIPRLYYNFLQASS